MQDVKLLYKALVFANCSQRGGGGSGGWGSHSCAFDNLCVSQRKAQMNDGQTVRGPFVVLGKKGKAVRSRSEYV